MKWTLIIIGVVLATANGAHAQASANFGRLPGSPPKVCVYDEGTPRTCVPFLSLNDATHSAVLGAGQTSIDALGEPRSLQSFGAVGDGVSDDTAVVQTALNSGVPLVCKGTFKLTSLVTITNKNVFMQGGSEGCTLVYNTNQTMLYFDLRSTSIFVHDHLTIKDVKLSINAAITAVTGPARTSAIYVTYPSIAGSTMPSVNIENVQVKPTTTSNYILNGIYLSNVTNAWISNTMYEGNATTVNPSSSAIVYDGTASPTNLHANNNYAAFVGTGILAPEQATNGWQGIRIDGFDCVFCGRIVDLKGALDGFSDYAQITNTEGAFGIGGIKVSNATHVLMHNNYVFNAGTISGITNPASPKCYEYLWTIAIPANGGSSSIANNTCDSIQSTGHTNRFGVSVTGTSGVSLNTIVASNVFSNMEFGWQLAANTAGVWVYPQVNKGVINIGQNNSTVGANVLVNFPIPYANHATNTATTGVTLTASEVSGGAASVTVAMMGATAGNLNVTMPTVASLVAILPNPQIGQSYILEILNGGGFTWTVTTNTGWTLSGTMTIATNTKRRFVLTINSMTAATLQNIGQNAI